MTALSGPRPITTRLGDDAVINLLKVPVAAGVKLYAGSMVMIDAGYLKPAATATGKKICGRVEKLYDNTAGSNGDLVAEVRRGTFKWNNSSSGDLIAQADVGKVCYAVDDQTVAKTDGSAARSPAGVILQVEADGVFVETGTNLLLADELLDT